MLFSDVTREKWYFVLSSILIFTTCFGKRDGILKEPNFNVEVWNSLNVFDTEFTGNLAKITKNLMEFSKFVMSINDNLDKVSAEVQKNLSSVTLELMAHQLPLNFSTMIFTKSLDQQLNRSTQNAFRTMKKYQRIIFTLQTHIMDIHEIVFEKVITGAGDLRKKLQNFIIDSNISIEELDSSQEKAYVEIFKAFGGMTDEHYEKIAKIIKGVATDLNRLLMRHPEIFQYSNAALKMMDDVDKCLMGFSQNNLNIYKVMDSYCTVLDVNLHAEEEHMQQYMKSAGSNMVEEYEFFKSKLNTELDKANNKILSQVAREVKKL